VEIQSLVSVSQIPPPAIKCVSPLVRTPIFVKRQAPFVSHLFPPAVAAKRMVRMQPFVSQLVQLIPNVLAVPTVVLRAFVSLHPLTRVQVQPMAMGAALPIQMVRPSVVSARRTPLPGI
jgi:hypothetical protein